MLTLRNVTKTYQKGRPDETTGLSAFDCSFPNAGMVFVLGRSGSGKSTLLHLLGGVDSPDNGEIVFNGTHIERLSAKEMDSYRKAYVGFCFQSPQLITQMTVEENIEIVCGGNANIKQILSDVGLPGFEKRNCAELSGGQAQRVAIARALAKEPLILICDEPTASLDEQSAALVMEALKKAAQDRLVVMATHDLSLASKYGDRMITLSDGRMTSDQTISEPGGKASSPSGRKKKTKIGLRLKIGVSSLLRKKAKTILSLVSLALSFGLSGVLIGSFLQDGESVLANSLLEESKTVAVAKTKNSSEPFSAPIAFTDSECKTIQREFGVSVPVFDGYADWNSGKRFSPADYGLSQPDSFSRDSRIGSNFQGYADANLLNSLSGVRLVAGTLPQSDDECVLPLICLRYWQKFGFQGNGKTYRPSDIPNAQSFLDGLPFVGAFAGGEWHPLRIVGFVDTGFDESLFPETIQINGLHGGLISNRLNNELFYGPHRLVYTHASFLSQYCQDRKMKRLDFPFLYRNQGYEQPSYLVGLSSDDTCIPIGDKSSTGVYLPCGSFADVYYGQRINDEAFVSRKYEDCAGYLTEFDALGEFEMGYRADYLFAAANSSKGVPLVWMACGDYVARRGIGEVADLPLLKADAQSELKRAFESGEISECPDLNDGSVRSLSLLKSFYVRRLVGTCYLKNRYAAISGYDLTSDFSRTLMPFLENGRMATFEYDSAATLSHHSTTQRVLGLCLPKANYADPVVSFAENTFAELDASLGLRDDYAFLLFPNSHDFTMMRKMVTGISIGATRLSAQHYVIGQYAYMGSFFWGGVSWVLGGLAFVFALISALLLNGSLRFSYLDRKKEFAVRRSMGLSAKGVFGELLFESLLVGVAAFIASIPFAFFASFLGNRFLSNISFTPLAFFSYSALACLAVILLMGTVCLLSSIGPCIQGSKQSLVSLLKED